jgi:hypothetical protein
MLKTLGVQHFVKKQEPLMMFAGKRKRERKAFAAKIIEMTGQPDTGVKPMEHTR